jgi:DNA repair protein SbcD/Mre11
VDLPAAGGVRVDAVDLTVGRRMASLRGTLAELLADPALAAAEDCWVQAVLTDQVPPRDAMARLRARFPHAATLCHDPPVTVGTAGSYAERVRGRDDLALVDDFVAHVTGRRLGPAERDDCARALAQTVVP